MVEIIKRPKTFSEKLAGGLANAAESLAPYAEMHFKNELDQKTKRAERAQKLAGLDDFKKTSYWKNASDLEKAVLEREILGDISAQTSKSLVNLERERETYETLSGLQGGEDNQPNEAPTSQTGEMDVEEPVRKPKFDYDNQIDKLDSQIDKWKPGLVSPKKDVRDTASKNIEQLNKKKDFAFKQREAEKKHQYQKGQMEYQEAKPTIEHANQLALNLPNQLQDLEGMEQALKSKDFGFFSTDNLAELTGVEGFRSKEGALLKSSIKNYFLGDVKGVGGKGLNQWLEQQLSDAMLKIGRDNAANETVLSGFKAKHDRDQAWYDAFRKLYKQQKEGQGYVNGDIGQEVAEKVKPYYEARQKQLEAEIKAIQKSGQALSGKMLDVVGPDGAEYEIDESQVGDLPEGFRLK